MQTILLGATTLAVVRCLNVMSMIDDVALPVGTYLEVTNFNDATLLYIDSKA